MTPYYDHAGITIYHGDCLEILPKVSADVLITDPPYGVDFRGKATKHKAASGGYTTQDSDIGLRVVKASLEIVKRGVVFPGNRILHKYPQPRDIGCVYCPSGAGCGPWGFTCFHPVLFYGKRPGGPTTPSSIQSFDVSDNPGGHPCAKPVRWLLWSVSLASCAGEVVFDPFAGSGTTLFAAKQLGRRAIGIEIEEKYCEIAAKRLSQEVFDFGGKA